MIRSELCDSRRRFSFRALTELAGPPDEPRHRAVEVGVDELGGRVLGAHARHGLPQHPVVVLRQAVEPPQAPRPAVVLRRRRVPRRAVLG